MIYKQMQKGHIVKDLDKIAELLANGDYEILEFNQKNENVMATDFPTLTISLKIAPTGRFIEGMKVDRIKNKE